MEKLTIILFWIQSLINCGLFHRVCCHGSLPSELKRTWVLHTLSTVFCNVFFFHVGGAWFWPECRKFVVFCLGFNYDTKRLAYPKLSRQSEAKPTPRFHDSPAQVFPSFAPATCICFEFWLVHWRACVLCDWPKWLLWLLFYDTHLKNALNMRVFLSFSQFEEDSIYRHLEPALAFQLEVYRLRNFDLQTIPTTNHNLHLYLGSAKKVWCLNWRYFIPWPCMISSLLTRYFSYSFLSEESIFNHVDIGYTINPPPNLTLNHFFWQLLPSECL